MSQQVTSDWRLDLSVGLQDLLCVRSGKAPWKRLLPGKPCRASGMRSRAERGLGQCEAPRPSLCESLCPAGLGLRHSGSMVLTLVWCILDSVWKSF